MKRDTKIIKNSDTVATLNYQNFKAEKEPMRPHVNRYIVHTMLIVSLLALAAFDTPAQAQQNPRLTPRFMTKPASGSNLGKLKRDYPNWKITRGLDAILEEIIASQWQQLK